MFQKITSLIKEKTLNIPYLLFANYSKLDITDEELIFLIYVINSDYKFDINLICNSIGKDNKKTLGIINSLINKDLISLNVEKKGTSREEYFCLDNLFKKLSFIVINDDIKEEKKTIFEDIEKEFGRTLSPIEYELINGWQQQYTDEIIFLALKEAVYNGVFNLRYIDKILYEWSKKGYKTKEQIETAKINHRKNKNTVKEVFDYDWLNDQNE